MTPKENIKTFLELIEVKTEVGINKLVNICIGTPEYEMLVKHIVSNINLLNQYGKSGENPSDNLKDTIGKDFE